MEVEILGPYPPPYGGVANHIYRLAKYLKKYGIAYRVYNQYYYQDTEDNIYATNKSFFWWINYLFKKNSNLVHFHAIKHLQLFYFRVYSIINNDNIIISIHNEGIINSSSFKRKIIISLLKKTKYKLLIVVSKKVLDYFISEGLKNVSYLPAYVPPLIEIDDLPQNEYLRSNKKNVFINMWKIRSKHTFDIYGIDLFIKMFQEYKNKCNFFIFCGSDENIHLLYDELDKNNAGEIKVVTKENLVEHYYYCDIALRLNRDDAYGVSSQEALDCGVMCIASDVCERPKGTILYKSGDFDSLKQKFEEVVNFSEEDKSRILTNKEELDYHFKLIDIYKSFSS